MADSPSETWQQVSERLGAGILALHNVVVQMQAALDSSTQSSEQLKAPIINQSDIGMVANQLFDMIDENSDGVIDRAEFRKLRNL